MKIDFTQAQLENLYRTGGDEAKKAIREALGEDFSDTLPVTSRIKTFEDARAELGDDNQLVRSYMSVKYGCSYATSEDKDLEAFLKMRIITAALNEGWQPNYTVCEMRWYPYFSLVPQEDIEEMSDEEKSRVVCRANSNASAFGGLVYAHAYNASTHSHSGVGSRVTFKSKELAEYAGQQFKEIYADFCFIIPNEAEK